MKNSAGVQGSFKSMPPFDLIAMDVDGTLLDSLGFISPGAEEAIIRAQEIGVRIALVTGRSQSTLKHVFQKVNLKGPFIGSGGAYIGDLGSGEVIQQRTLPRVEVEALIRMCRELGVIVFLDHSDFMLCEKENEEMRRSKETHGYSWECVPDLIQAMSALPEKALVIGEKEKLLLLSKYYQDNTHEVDITFTGPTSMDILPHGVGKGMALKILADYLKIPRKRIAVIGDYLNDLEMFRVAGTAVAMGNAPREVKEAANFIAPTNDEGGVAWALHKLLNTKEEKA